MGYRCPFCGDRFESLMTFKVHVKKIHLDGHAATTCPVCGLNLANYQGVLNHMKWMVRVGDEMHAAAYIALTTRRGRLSKLRKKAYEMLRVT